MTPRLNRRLVLETPETIPDGAGGFDSVWVALGTIWGEVTARTGRELAQAEAAISRMSFRIVVRAAPFGSPDRPQPQQRFREGQRIFLIEAVAEEDADTRYLTCFATEEVAV
ncbi:head-tail adaptor protein [Sulfitobacter sp. D35]|uniref:head-tail adaptor protein n=1 Tax=Sulfitobacter sp. D35 TaxID=3083252 RepID=UPI00296FB91C|nr:head-tail adaptor protein [Sulfitobacter sp. D35]MDW4496816.1 head-tail adaptor protein [Sulfitobacter sp. D35]